MLVYKSAVRVFCPHAPGGWLCMFVLLTAAFVSRTSLNIQFPFVFSLTKPDLALDAAAQSETGSSRSLVPTICSHFLPDFVLGQSGLTLLNTVNLQSLNVYK